MNGSIDESQRALLSVPVSKSDTETAVPITVWIDTAFDGHLVCSQALIDDLKLEPLAETDAILADGSQVVLETFLCYVDWFDQRIPIQVIANEGKYPLLGTGLLQGRVLHIDYAQRVVTLN